MVQAVASPIKTVALIPYYGGDSPIGTNSPDRVEYLVRTVANASLVAEKVYVGTGRSIDTAVAETTGAEVIRFNYGGSPWHLPALLNIAAQERLAEGYTHVYVTEADQLLYYDPDVLEIIKDTTYLVPHRVEKISPSGGGQHAGPNVLINDKWYVISSGAAWWDDYKENMPGDYYEAKLKYGGGFFCTTELFRQAEFQLLGSGETPLETATGYAIAAAGGTCLRPTVWHRFWVEHLSAERYWAGLAGPPR